MWGVSVSVAFLEKIWRGWVSVDVEEIGVGVEGRRGSEVYDAGFASARGGEECERFFRVGFVMGIEAGVVVSCKDVSVRVMNG